MTEQDLDSFGQKLRQFRLNDGYSQDKVAEKLLKIHARQVPDIEMRLDGNRISKWELAFVDKKGRPRRPGREHVLYLIELFALQLTLESAQAWAAQAGYRLKPSELTAIFTSAVASPGPIIPPPLLPSSHSQRLFGVEAKLAELRQLLQPATEPWLVAIFGLGGLGKTSLAQLLATEMISPDCFQAMAWVSAKQVEFGPGGSAHSLGQPALNEDTLVNSLLAQLSAHPFVSVSLADKITKLIELVQQTPTLIIVDNLETAVDYEALLPLLRRLSRPSKVLITSRISLRGQAGVHSLGLNELPETEALELLRYEGQSRGLTMLAEADETELQRILQVVGGNPLALKLVVGQLGILPLAQVLDNLKVAQGPQNDQFFTYIYWQAWHSLDEAARHALLAMPLLAQGGTFEHLRVVSELEPADLMPALTELVKRSLVDVRGTLVEPRYAIHRLTETFLLTEVIKWQ
jgi:hypothetical protein